MKLYRYINNSDKTPECLGNWNDQDKKVQNSPGGNVKPNISSQNYASCK